MTTERSELTEHRIEIEVATAYIPEQSDPQSSRFVFAYHITIRNIGAAPVQLLNRHWIIRDARDQVQEVRGEGVVGKQPRISPGQEFEYTSGTILETPVGTMEGSYGMRDDAGFTFRAPIPTFTLSMPRSLH